MQFGEFVQEGFGMGVRRQDAADRRQREAPKRTARSRAVRTS